MSSFSSSKYNNYDDNGWEDHEEEDFSFKSTPEQHITRRRGGSASASCSTGSSNKWSRKRNDETKLKSKKKKKKKEEEGERRKKKKKKKRRTPSNQIITNSSIDSSGDRGRMDSDYSYRSSIGNNNKTMNRTNGNGDGSDDDGSDAEHESQHDEVQVVKRSGMKHEKRKKKRRRKQHDSNNTSIVKGSNNLSSSPSSSSSSPSPSPSSLNLLDNLPFNLNNPKQLKWHKRFIPGLQKPMYYPCRIVPEDSSKSKSKKFSLLKKTHNLDFSSSSSDSNCNSDSNDDDDDDDDEVQIEYISNIKSHIRKKRSSTTTSISSPTTKHYKTIRKNRLIPYYGQLSNEEQESLDYNDIVSSKWCKKLYDQYKQQQQQHQQQDKPQQGRSRVHLQQLSTTRHYEDNDELFVDLSYLNDILTITKQRAGFVATTISSGRSRSNNNENEDTRITTPCNHKKKGKQCSSDSSDDDLIEPFDNLQEPYTQQIDFKALGYNSSDAEVEEFYRDLKKHPSDGGTTSNNNNNNNKRREPILPGDVIEYYHPVFVFGDERGKRITTVISVNPKNKHSILQLSNQESLPKDVKIRRIKTLIEDDTGSSNMSDDDNNTGNNNTATVNNVKRRLIDHPGVFREIQEFKLVKLNAIKGYHITTEKDRVKGILRKNMKKFEKKAKASGFAPLDLMNNFGLEKGRGGCNSSVDDNSDSSPVKSKSPKDSMKHSRHSSCSSSDSDNDLKAIYEVHKQVKTNSHTPLPASTSSKRRVTETNSQNYHEENSSDDDEMMKKLNHHYDTLTKESKFGRDFHSKAGKKTEYNKNKHKTRKSPVPLLSLRDTDEEDNAEHMLYDDAKKIQQVDRNNISSSSGKRKKMDFFKSLGLSDSDDDELDSAIFSRGNKQANQIRNDKHLENQMNTSSTAKTEKALKYDSHDNESSPDFYSSISKTAKSHQKFKSANEISRKYSSFESRLVNESKLKTNQSSKRVSMIENGKPNRAQKSSSFSPKFKILKHN